MNLDLIKRTLGLAVVAIIVTSSALAQGNAALQEKLASVKESMAANKQKLSQYQWVESTQLTLKGDPKGTTQDSCQYGPDGKVQKTPLGPPPADPSGGRMKQRIIEKKKAEMQQYMGGVKALLAQYLPPDPQKIEAAHAAGNVSLNPVGGLVNLIFANYALPGDKMTLTFDPNAKKITAINVNTYMDDPKDVVTLQVQMASLPDGTNYTQQTVLNATAKQLIVTTTNSNYQKIGGYGN
jgi:hypothetical protein